MDVMLVFVPPGGGGCRGVINCELDRLPRIGDHIEIKRDGDDETEDFIVLRNKWLITRTDDKRGVLKKVEIECEYAEAANSTTAHRWECNYFDNKHRTPKKIDSTT